MEKLLNKIQKLLNLADSKNENEAKAAMLKAQRLMAENKIKMEDIEGKEEGEIEEDLIFDNYGRHRNWKYSLGNVIAENFNCQSMKRTTYGKSNLVFVGHQEDVKIAKKIFRFAENVASDNALKYARKRAHETGFKKAYLKNDYILGFIKGLKDKFEEQKEQIKKETGLILKKDAKVNEFIDKNYNIKTRRSKGVNVTGDKKARDKGYDRGRSLGLNRELNN